MIARVSGNLRGKFLHQKEGIARIAVRASTFVFLSKSMGHSTLGSTYYYYHLIPEFFPKLQHLTGTTYHAIVPEVEYEEDI